MTRGWKEQYGASENLTPWLTKLWLNMEPLNEAHSIRQIFYRYFPEISAYVPEAVKLKMPHWANYIYAQMIRCLSRLVKTGKASYIKMNIYDGSGAFEWIWQDFDNPRPTEEEAWVEYPIELWVENNATFYSLFPLFNWDHNRQAPKRFRLNLISGKGYAKAQQIEQLLRERSDDVEIIAYFSDFDPDGCRMPYSVQEAIDFMSKHADLPNNIHVERIGVLPHQIPTERREAQMITPNWRSRSSKWFLETYHTKECYEMQALMPHEMRDIVANKLEGIIKSHSLERRSK